MTVFWLFFALKFYFNKNPSLKLTILVMTIPVLTLFFNVTNEFHHLFYKNISIVNYEGFITAHLTKGPWYIVNAAYSYLVLLIGIVAFYKAWRHSLYTMRIQSLLMLIGAIFPIIVNIIYLVGLAPYSLDLTPFGLGILAIFYFIALFRYEFLDAGEIIRSVVFSEMSEGIIVVDNKNRLVDFNNAALKLFSFLNSKTIGMELAKIKEIKEIIKDKSNSYEIEVASEGIPYYYELRFTDLYEKDKVLGSVVFIRDITTQKELIHQLDMMANYDSLTQVYNRRKIMEEATKEALRTKRHNGFLSVLMIDIDFFKSINDKYGHLAGDEVIKLVINVCKEMVRSTI